MALKNEENITNLELLKKFAPGTSLRNALDDIVSAGMGALIVLDKDGLTKVMEGGFKINCKFTSQKLVELAKMDGAIILSDDFKKILFANVLLVPSIEMISKETGTRHKAAERTSKQIGNIVVAASERKKKITIYYKDFRYELEPSSEILSRAVENLQMLEKQKEIFDDLLAKLNLLEIQDLVTTTDVCNVLQRIEIIQRISDIVKGYLVELGKEGMIVSMRLKELTKHLSYEKEEILKDYFKLKSSKVDSTLKEMNFDFLIETPNLVRILFEQLNDKHVYPIGFRIINKLNLLEKDKLILMNSFTTLRKIFYSSKDELSSIFKNKDLAYSLRRSLDSLKEKIMFEKKL